MKSQITMTGNGNSNMVSSCQFCINNRLGRFEQLTITVEMTPKVCNRKINETTKKVLETQGN